jgi:hypothetical protein
MNTIEALIKLKKELQDSSDIYVTSTWAGFEIFSKKDDDCILYTMNLGKEVADFLGVNYEK